MSKLIEEILVPDENGTCVEWKTFHESLKKKYGRDNAKTIWVMAWSHATSDSCLLDQDFVRYFKSNGIDIGNAFSDIAGSTLGLTGDILGMAGSTAKFLKWALPLTATALIGISIYFLAKTAKDLTPEQAIAMIPAPSVGTSVPVTPPV